MFTLSQNEIQSTNFQQKLKKSIIMVVTECWHWIFTTTRHCSIL